MHLNDRPEMPAPATKPVDAPPSTSQSEPAVAPREIELKLHVPLASVARLWTQAAVVDCAIGPRTVARIENRYFDTPARDLATRGMALRLRRIGRSWVQTLKASGTLEGALSARDEWEMPVAGPALELRHLRGTPIETIASTRSLARRLQPVFTTDFRRESQRLHLADGCEIEFAFDSGWIHAGSGRTKRSLPIREVELEVKVVGDSAPARSLLRFADRFVREVPLIALGESKAARGYRLVDDHVLEAFKVALPVPEGSERTSIHLARVMSACTDALLGNAHALIERGVARPLADIDPEFVHQARVAIRRMRSALRTFGPVAKGRRIRAVDERLQMLGQAFGQARDWDVFVSATMKRLDGKVTTDDAGRAALAELRLVSQSQRHDAYLALLAQLDLGPFGSLSIDLLRVAARIDRSDATGGPTLDACVPDWLAAQRDRIVRRSRRIAVLDVEQRHGLRVEVKRLRYALDLFESLYDPALVATFHDALTELQDRLGKLNDEVVADRLLQSLGPSTSRDLVVARYAEWLTRHIPKQLPKVAALSVAFELAREPWSRAVARATSLS